MHPFWKVLISLKKIADPKPLNAKLVYACLKYILSAVMSIAWTVF